LGELERRLNEGGTQNSKAEDMLFEAKSLVLEAMRNVKVEETSVLDALTVSFFICTKKMGYTYLW
jgi:hypothetical protein